MNNKDLKFKMSSDVKPVFTLFDFGNHQLLCQNKHFWNEAGPVVFKIDMTKYCL